MKRQLSAWYTNVSLAMHLYLLLLQSINNFCSLNWREPKHSTNKRESVLGWASAKVSRLITLCRVRARGTDKHSLSSLKHLLMTAYEFCLRMDVSTAACNSNYTIDMVSIVDDIRHFRFWPTTNKLSISIWMDDGLSDPCTEHNIRSSRGFKNTNINTLWQRNIQHFSTLFHSVAYVSIVCTMRAYIQRLRASSHNILCETKMREKKKQIMNITELVISVSSFCSFTDFMQIEKWCRVNPSKQYTITNRRHNSIWVKISKNFFFFYFCFFFVHQFLCVSWNFFLNFTFIWNFTVGRYQDLLWADLCCVWLINGFNENGFCFVSAVCWTWKCVCVWVSRAVQHQIYAANQANGCVLISKLDEHLEISYITFILSVRTSLLI